MLCLGVRWKKNERISEGRVENGNMLQTLSFLVVFYKGMQRKSDIYYFDGFVKLSNSFFKKIKVRIFFSFKIQ